MTREQRIGISTAAALFGLAGALAAIHRGLGRGFSPLEVAAAFAAILVVAVGVRIAAR